MKTYELIILWAFSSFRWLLPAYTRSSAKAGISTSRSNCAFLYSIWRCHFFSHAFVREKNCKPLYPSVSHFFFFAWEFFSPHNTFQNNIFWWRKIAFTLDRNFYSLKWKAFVIPFTYLMCSTCVTFAMGFLRFYIILCVPLMLGPRLVV